MIKFFRGLRASYTYTTETPGKLLDALFFATDTGELLLNGKQYGADGEKLKDVEFNDGVFTFTKFDNSTVVIDIKDKLITEADRTLLDTLSNMFEGEKMNVTYNSKLDNTVATVDKLGGIAAGTKVSQLSGKTISEVLDTLIFPTIQPTIVAPSVSISLKTGISNIKEIGADGYTTNDFNTSFSRGSIKIGATTQNPRSGEKSIDVIYAGSESNGIPNKVTAGTTNFYYKVSYAEGPAPLDSKGNAAASYTALPAGSITSSALPVYGVYPFYANVTNTSATKLPLTKDLTFIVKLAAEGPNKHIFKLPHTVTKIEMLNTLSGNYEVYALDNFTPGTETISVQDTDVTYNTYTRNDAGFNGETTYRITYSK